MPAGSSTPALHPLLRVAWLSPANSPRCHRQCGPSAAKHAAGRRPDRDARAGWRAPPARETSAPRAPRTRRPARRTRAPVGCRVPPRTCPAAPRPTPQTAKAASSRRGSAPAHRRRLIPARGIRPPRNRRHAAESTCGPAPTPFPQVGVHCRPSPVPAPPAAPASGPQFSCQPNCEYTECDNGTDQRMSRPIRVAPYTDEWVHAVRAFNQRIAASQQQLPETPRPDWMPRMEVFLAVEDDAVRGGYILRRQCFWAAGQETAVAHYRLPLSEGVVNRDYATLGLRLVRDALAREPRLYAMGMGGWDKPLPQMLKRLGWRMCEVPFFFKVLRPSPFLRNIRPLRTTALRRLALDAAALTGAGW